MSDTVPSKNEEPILRHKALYMGTTLFKTDAENFDEKDISLVHLQETIAKRYPIDGSNFSKGNFRILVVLKENF